MILSSVWKNVLCLCELFYFIMTTCVHFVQAIQRTRHKFCHLPTSDRTSWNLGVDIAVNLHKLKQNQIHH